MAHPLLCWDICLEGLHRRMQLADDLKIMQNIMKAGNWHNTLVSLDNTLVWENKVIIITDPTLKIIHATENMFAMNGYKQKDVIGKSPSMFQGAKTEIIERQKIKIAVDKQNSFESIITNYKKDGSIYKCHIEGHPVFNKKGNLVNFIAIENAA
ncbi:MAG: PAS domain-containing protein [Lacibacter sp.]|jgi:PAS domain S-box-containing protein